MKTWSYKNNKEIVQAIIIKKSKCATRECHHSRALSFNQITIENQKVFIEAAVMIRQVIPNAVLSAFGSRMVGNFLTVSDFDIIIWNEDEDKYRQVIEEKLTQHDHRIDFQFGKGETENLTHILHGVLIP